MAPPQPVFFAACRPAKNTGWGPGYPLYSARCGAVQLALPVVCPEGQPPVRAASRAPQRTSYRCYPLRTVPNQRFVALAPQMPYQTEAQSRDSRFCVSLLARWSRLLNQSQSTVFQHCTFVNCLHGSETQNLASLLCASVLDSI